MTSLEKFLVKRQSAKIIESSKEKEIPAIQADIELTNTISELKSIFPNESEESLMLLALQYPNRKNLEVAVQKILEESSSFKEVRDSWNVVKSRDKKKPEPKKKFQRDFRDKKQFGEENEYRGKKDYREQKGYLNKGKYQKNEEIERKSTEKPKENEKIEGKEKNNGISESFVAKAEVKEPETIVVENTSLVEEETKVIPKAKELDYNEFPDFSNKSHKPTQGKWVKRESKVQNSVVETKEPLFVENPPEVIKIEESPPIITIPEISAEKVLSQSVSEPQPLGNSKVSDKLPELSQTTSKQDFGVQVDIDYGIPIIVYPYMFQHKPN